MRLATCLLLTIATIAPTWASAQAPQKVSYSDARRTGRSYECSYGAPFMGLTVFFRSHVRGDDFQALNVSEIDPQTILDPPRWSLRESSLSFEQHLAEAPARYWRIGDLYYMWQSEGPRLAIRFDLGAVDAAVPNPSSKLNLRTFLSGVPKNELMLLALAVPPKHASCTPIDRAILDLPPGVVFTDVTKKMIEEAKQSLENPQKNLIDSLGFGVYLPSNLLGEVPDFQIRAAEADAYVRQIQFVHLRELDEVADEKQLLQLNIFEKKLEKPGPDPFPDVATREECAAGADSRNCVPWRTTPRGRQVFGWPPDGLFYFSIDSTFIFVSVIRHAGASDPYRYVPPKVKYAFEPEALDAFVDSFALVEPDAVYHMRFREDMITTE